MMINILLIFFGLSLLFAGGEILIRGAVAIAKILGLSTLLVSTVIVGFGTSTPELVVSINSALSGSSEIALGNIVGSNIANILLILGLSSLFAPICCKNKTILRDSFIVFFASAFLAVLSLFSPVNLLTGGILVTFLLSYLGFSIWTEKKSEVKDHAGAGATATTDTRNSLPWTSITKQFLLCVFGLTLLIFGAKFLLDGAVAIAMSFGISEAVIGLTLVAVGTSLPELITAIIASLKKQSDVIIGNILGSNLFNILGILGITGMISTIPFDGRIADTDIWIMLGVSALAIPIIMTGYKVSRIEGGAFLFLYTTYTVWLFIQS